MILFKKKEWYEYKDFEKVKIDIPKTLEIDSSLFKVGESKNYIF